MTIQRTYEPTDLVSKHSESKRARILYPYQVTELVLVSIPSRTAAARSARVIGPPAAGTICHEPEPKSAKVATTGAHAGLGGSRGVVGEI